MSLCYRFLDIGFFIFHSALILFILFGWIWRRTRLANAAINLAIAFSWGILGIWYGFGYCPCTEWHWRVRQHLGKSGMPRSYIKFLLDRITGGDAPAGWVDGITAAAFCIVFLLSISLAARDWFRLRRQQAGAVQATLYNNDE